MWIGTNGSPSLPKVWVADADGGNRLDVLTTPSHDPTGVSDPAWSPNGSKIAFSGSVTTGSVTGVHIFVANPDGSGRLAVSAIDNETLCAPTTTTTTTTSTSTIPGTPPTQPPSTTTSLPGGNPECPTAPAPFTDVSPTSFARADIDCIYGLGITTGTSPTQYSPNGLVTREQMASFLARLWRTVGGSCPTGSTPFTDVAPTSFAFEDVKCLYGLSFTTGTTPTTYAPANTLTREQMASFLARVWRGAGESCPTAAAPFTDVSPTSFARLDINCIYGLGITTGTSPTQYSPNDPVTREQMAAFLGRLYRAL